MVENTRCLTERLRWPRTKLTELHGEKYPECMIRYQTVLKHHDLRAAGRPSGVEPNGETLTWEPQKTRPLSSSFQDEKRTPANSVFHPFLLRFRDLNPVVLDQTNWRGVSPNTIPKVNHIPELRKPFRPTKPFKHSKHGSLSLPGSCQRNDVRAASSIAMSALYKLY